MAFLDFLLGGPETFVTEHWYIVDDMGQWPITKQHAEDGLAEGWLIVMRYNLDIWGEQHYFLTMV